MQQRLGRDLYYGYCSVYGRHDQFREVISGQKVGLGWKQQQGDNAGAWRHQNVFPFENSGGVCVRARASGESISVTLNNAKREKDF